MDDLTAPADLTADGPTCPTCKGSGVDPSPKTHRYTTGGRDEDPPCERCGGTGELPAD